VDSRLGIADLFGYTRSVQPEARHIDCYAVSLRYLFRSKAAAARRH
jgi:hypothetical protein